MLRIVLPVLMLCIGLNAAAQTRARPSLPIPMPLFGEYQGSVVGH
jgi:hypothetical protein